MNLSHVVIRASAGTGKTFQLSNRYIQLLHLGATPDQILATTFTRKAAAEIIHRIIVRLADAAVDDGTCKELGGHIGAHDLDFPWHPQRCQQLLRQMLHSLHQVRIDTLDSFFAQIARSFSLELGLPVGWNMMDELVERQIRGQAVDTLLQGDSANDISRLMNLMSKGDAEQSVHQLLRETVDRLLVIYQASHRDAWQQISRQRFMKDEQMDRALVELEQVELPNRKRFQKAHLDACERAKQGDWEAFLEKGIAKVIFLGKTTFDRLEISQDVLAAYKPLVTFAKATLVNQLAIQTEATYELIEKFDRVYQMSKLDARALRFDDVMYQLIENFQMRDTSRLEMRLDGNVCHLLLDEFQDTSAAQWQILRPFAQRITNRPNRVVDTSNNRQRRLFPEDLCDEGFGSRNGSGTFFCVGDVKQAIYGWRGGDANLFDVLDKDLGGLKKSQLNENFRSSQPIVDTVNRIFTEMGQHDSLRDEIQATIRQWTSSFPTHTANKRQLRGYASLMTAPTPTENETSDKATIRFAVQQVEKIARSTPGCSIGVLARRNTVVAELIYELRQLGILASEEGGNPLTDSAAVATILSLLRITDHPGDTISRAHVAQSPLGSIVGLESYVDHVAAQQLAQRTRRSLVEGGYGKTIYHLSQSLMPFCTSREWRRLRQLVELAYVFDSQATLRATDFVQHIELQKVIDPTASAIRVMTVHQAKGLQFDAVVLVDLDTSLRSQPPACVVGKSDPASRADTVCLYRNSTIQSALPEKLQVVFRQALERATFEELCVLYVAVTRSIHALYMIIQPATGKLMATHAGLLRAALTDGVRAEPETTLYEHGERDWFEGHMVEQLGTNHELDSVFRSERRHLVAPIRLRESVAKRENLLQRVVPSALEERSRIRVRNILDLQNEIVLHRGNLFHAWHEQIGWLEDGFPDKNKLRRIADKFPTAKFNVDVELHNFYEYLDDPAIRSVLQRSCYLLDGREQDNVVVRTEHPFAVSHAGQLITGSIDRLVLLERQGSIEAADVIDFKTDRLDTEDSDILDARVQHYTPQLEAYRLAVSKMFVLELKSISTRLVFVNSRCVVPLADKVVKDGVGKPRMT